MLLKDISDLDLVSRLSHGKVDLTFGRYVGTSNAFIDKKTPLFLSIIVLSALDIFGGTQVAFLDLVQFNSQLRP